MPPPLPHVTTSQNQTRSVPIPCLRSAPFPQSFLQESGGRLRANHGIYLGEDLDRGVAVHPPGELVVQELVGTCLTSRHRWRNGKKLPSDQERRLLMANLASEL